MKFESVLLTQSKTNDCGVTVLRMLLAFIYKNRRFLTTPISGNLDNLLTIKKKALEFGVRLEGFVVKEPDIILKIKGPFIAQIKRGAINHFVLCRVKGYVLEINDPSGDFYKLSLKKPLKYFISNILVVNCVENKPQLPKYSFKYKALPILFSGLFLVFIAFGFAFIGHPSLDLISYVSFTVAAIIKIWEERVIIHSFISFDLRYIQKSIIRSKNIREDFSALQSAKEEVYSYPLRLFNTLITVISICALLILNNYFLAIICLFLLIFAYFEVKVSNTRKTKDWSLVTNLAYLESKVGLERGDLYQKIIVESAKIAKLHVYRKTIYSFTLGVMIFILMYFTKTYTLNYFVFYFFAFSYLFFEIKKLFTLYLVKKDYYKAINIINNAF